MIIGRISFWKFEPEREAGTTVKAIPAPVRIGSDHPIRPSLSIFPLRAPNPRKVGRIVHAGSVLALMFHRPSLDPNLLPGWWSNYETPDPNSPKPKHFAP